MKKDILWNLKYKKCSCCGKDLPINRIWYFVNDNIYCCREETYYVKKETYDNIKKRDND
tara:strand:- start:385 stop:561 length:177 start_codon:yes stop_codon:yes gene_type:complete